MDFWSQFYSESLHSPWLIAPDQPGVPVANPKLDNHRIFIVEGSVTDQGLEMVSKMITALKYDLDSVSVILASADVLQQLESLSESKKIITFGVELAGPFGMVTHWAGHQLIQTHGIMQLLEQPQLKKQTWEHLKEYSKI